MSILKIEQKLIQLQFMVDSHRKCIVSCSLGAILLYTHYIDRSFYTSKEHNFLVLLWWWLIWWVRFRFKQSAFFKIKFPCKISNFYKKIWFTPIVLKLQKWIKKKNISIKYEILSQKTTSSYLFECTKPSLCRYKLIIFEIFIKNGITVHIPNDCMFYDLISALHTGQHLMVFENNP